MLDLLKELYTDVPPPATTVRGVPVFGTRSALAPSKPKKNSWVEQRVLELTELANCMVIAGYNRYPVRDCILVVQNTFINIFCVLSSLVSLGG